MGLRSLAQALGVQPMALYHHLPNKAAILDGVIDLVFAEIDLPVPAEHVLRPGCDFGDELAFGLDLILDGLAAAAARES